METPEEKAEFTLQFMGGLLIIILWLCAIAIICKFTWHYVFGG